MHQFTVDGVTRDKYTRLAAKVQKELNTVTLGNDSGEGSGQGLDIKWVYTADSPALPLTFTVVRKPMFIFDDIIESELRKFVAEA